MIRSKAGIYQLYNEDKDIYYIGQSSDLARRKTSHFSALKSGSHPNKAMQNDYTNGDSFTYSIITKCPNYERLLLSEEARYITQFKEAGKQLYNVNDSYCFLITNEQLLYTIADNFCRDKFGLTYRQMTLGNSPARFDYLFRTIYEEGFNPEEEKMIYFDIGYYYRDIAKCDIRGGEIK